MSILADIVKLKKVELALAKKRRPLQSLVAEAEGRKPLDLIRSLNERGGIIAEVKRASPSKKDLMRPSTDIIRLARAYERNGASAISVLTESNFFKGGLKDLVGIRESVGIPLLRKDFIIDEYQVHEAKAHGADAILLIVAILTPLRLKRLIRLASELGLSCIVEVHDRAELKTALSTPAAIIGINNRNLKTFEVDIDTSVRLAKLIPEDRFIISESGIKSRLDIVRLREVGVRGFLIGETLIKSPSPGKKLRELAGEHD